LASCSFLGLFSSAAASLRGRADREVERKKREKREEAAAQLSGHRHRHRRLHHQRAWAGQGAERAV
jgi:hypothetical protein